MSTTNQDNTNKVNQSFIATSYDGPEGQELLSEVGNLVFQSSLMRYLADATPEQMIIFEKYIKVNADKEDFIEQLCIQYPAFAVIFNDELEAFQKELS